MVPKACGRLGDDKEDAVDDRSLTTGFHVTLGLDYPGVGPEHAFLKDSGRASYVPVTDDQALEVR